MIPNVSDDSNALRRWGGSGRTAHHARAPAPEDHTGSGMKAAEFGYARARSTAHAVELLAETPGSRLIAGGQSLGPMLNLRLARPGASSTSARAPSFAGTWRRRTRWSTAPRSPTVRSRTETCPIRPRGGFGARPGTSRTVRSGTVGPSGEPRARRPRRRLADGAGRGWGGGVDRGPRRGARRTAPLLHSRTVRDHPLGRGSPHRRPGAAAVNRLAPRILQALGEERRVRAGARGRARGSGTEHETCGDRAIERTPLVVDGEDAFPETVADAQALLVPRLPAGTGGRLHAAALARASRALARDGAERAGAGRQVRSSRGPGDPCRTRERSGPGCRVATRVDGSDPGAHRRQRKEGGCRARAPHAPRRLPARAPPAHRNPPRLRARCLRRVHGAH